MYLELIIPHGIHLVVGFHRNRIVVAGKQAKEVG